MADSVNSCRSRRLALLLLVVTFAVFHDVLRAGFVRWDDDLHVYANPYLHPVSLAHVARFWAAPYQNLYVPVSYSVYSLLALGARLPAPTRSSDGFWIDLSPYPFHAACLALHAANVLLVFLLLRRLIRSDWGAAGGAVLFAIHPVQVESVAWIGELRGLLAAFFCLLALHTYLRHAEINKNETAAHRRWFALATTLFALALLSKPSAVTLPLLAGVLVWLRGEGGRARRWELAGWGVLSLGLLALTHGAQPVTVDIVVPAWQRPFVAGDALAFHGGKLLWPATLGIDYGRGPVGLMAHGWGYVTGLVPLALGVWLWRQRRTWPVLAAAGALFGAALLPTLGLTPFTFQTFSTVADRYLYLALLGPALALAWGLARLEVCPLPRARLAGATACLSVLLLWGLRANVQTLCWANSVALFRQALAVNPRSWASASNLGGVLLDQGQPQEARAVLAQAVSLRPGFAEARVNLGIALFRVGDPAGAEREFRAACALHPDFANASTGLGDTLLAEGRPAEAANAFRQALASEAGKPEAMEGLRLAQASPAAHQNRAATPPP